MVIVDHRFFIPTTIPPHDMYQGAAFFATNLHALRYEGDLAWWNPIADFGGYAQYYQSFLSPLAPTCGHPVFIAWALLVRALSGAGITVPEYYQYLLAIYVIFPWLAFVAFFWLCTSLFVSRAAVLLAGIVFVFSGIGLWDSAWFYFQEPFTLYFLLGTSIAALRRPVPSRLLMLLLAFLVQIASFNYWSLYNTWFLLLALGSYAGFNWNQTHRLVRRVGILWRTHRVGVTLPVAATCIATTASLVLVAMVASVGGDYVRLEQVSGSGHYGVEAAASRVQEVRSFTTDFFNVDFRGAVEMYPRLNPMHSARYLGAELVPLLAVFAVMRWGRRERWLVTCAAGVLCVCLGPPLLLYLWAATPGMDRILHLFYFYSHHLQVLVALAAAAALDSVLVRRVRGAHRRMIGRVVAAILGVSMLGLVEFGVLSTAFPSGDARLQAGLVFALTSLIVGVVVLRQVAWPSVPHRRLLVAVLLVLTFADLTRYFWLVERADITFTVGLRYKQPIPNPLPLDLQATLRRPWTPPDPAQEFAGGIQQNMPIANDFWPQNSYLMPRYVVELANVAGTRALARRPALTYFPSQQVRTARGDAIEVASPHPELLLTGGDDLPADDHDASPSKGLLGYRFRDWRYNGFTIDLRTPGAGWLLIAQVFDPAWQITVDGERRVPRRAEHDLIAVPIPARAHTLVMNYRPRVRSLYWPTAELVIASCVGLAAMSAVCARSRRPRLGVARQGPQDVGAPHAA